MSKKDGGSKVGRSNIDFTHDEHVVLEKGRKTWTFLKKTLANWVEIGECVALCRAKADRMGGRDAFAEVMEAAGFGDMTTAKLKWLPSLLEKIVDPDVLPRVQAWHAKLDLHQQLAWASPRSIIRHAVDEDGTRIFPPANAATHQPPTPPATVIKNLKEEVRDLKAQVDELEAARPATGNPLEALNAGEIVDLILKLKKSTRDAIIHDLTKETPPAQG